MILVKMDGRSFYCLYLLFELYGYLFLCVSRAILVTINTAQNLKHNFMKSLFARFVYSWTPYFLPKFRSSLTIGVGIGYYALGWLVIAIVSIVVGGITVWHFSTPEKILPYLDQVPAFSLQFQGNNLIKTNFPQNPYIFNIYDEVHKRFPDANVKNDIDIIYISTKETDVPEQYKNVRWIYVLRDWVVSTVQIQWQNNENIEKVPYKLSDMVVDNALMKTKAAEFYPAIRTKVLIFAIPIVSFLAAIFGFCVYLFFTLFWAFIVWIVSRFLPKKPSFDFVWSFVLHTFFPVTILTFAFGYFGIWFPFFSTILFVILYIVNVHSRV